MKHKVHILGYEAARAFVPEVPTLAVRIYDCVTRDYCDARGNWDNGPKAPMQESPLWVGDVAHGWRFADSDPDHAAKYSEDDARKIREHYADSDHWIITDQIAREMVEYFREHYQSAQALLFHCNAGLSRSPAAAMAMKKLFDLDAEWAPRAQRLIAASKGNLTVYNTLLKAGP